jgi:hypothetical protein
VPFRSDIPGRPETQVGRWHAMRKRGDEAEEGQGGEVGLAEDVDWETIWNRSLRGNDVPPALRELRCVLRLCYPFLPSFIMYDDYSFSSPENRTCIPLSLSPTTHPRVSTSRFPRSH